MLQFLKPGLGATVFGVRLLIAFAAPPLTFAAFAHDTHPPARQAAKTDESAFLAENTAAMDKMMTGMDGKADGRCRSRFRRNDDPAPSGRHRHGGDLLRYGKNEQLRRLAQEIIVSQQQEIAAMKLALGQPVPASAPQPDARRPRCRRTHHTSMSRRDEEIGTRQMNYSTLKAAFWPARSSPPRRPACAGQAPGAAASPDFPLSRRDRVYAAEQFSNTVSVTDPVDNKLLGVIRLGDPQPAISARSIAARCWSTAWASRPTTRPSLSSRSARTP